ncbi:MAG: hypothetical protein E3J53_04240, partial [Desulfobacteraceae bacterium]
MGRHGQGLPVGETVQGHLAVVGPAPPGVDKLGPVCEDQEYPGCGYTFEKLFEGILGASVHPVQILYGHDEGAKLGTSEDNPFQGLQASVFPGLGAHGNRVNAAVFHGEEFQEIGEGGGFIDLEELETPGDLIPDLLMRIVILDVKVGPQDIDYGMVGDVSAVGEASALKEGDVLIG